MSGSRTRSESEISSAECEMKKVCRDKAERVGPLSLCRLCDPIFRDQTRSLSFPLYNLRHLAGDEVLWTIYCLALALAAIQLPRT